MLARTGAEIVAWIGSRSWVPSTSWLQRWLRRSTVYAVWSAVVAPWGGGGELGAVGGPPAGCSVAVKVGPLAWPLAGPPLSGLS
jgi:hypothetical protein